MIIDDDRIELRDLMHRTFDDAAPSPDFLERLADLGQGTTRLDDLVSEPGRLRRNRRRSWPVSALVAAVVVVVVTAGVTVARQVSQGSGPPAEPAVAATFATSEVRTPLASGMTVSLQNAGTGSTAATDPSAIASVAKAIPRMPWALGSYGPAVKAQIVALGSALGIHLTVTVEVVPDFPAAPGTVVAQSPGPGDSMSATTPILLRIAPGDISRFVLLQGQLRTVGGSSPGQARPLAGQVVVYARVRGRADTVATASTDAAGHYTISVEPGTYYLTGQASGSGPAYCRSATFTAARGATQHIDTDCPIK